jgi:hypothetical protein
MVGKRIFTSGVINLPVSKHIAGKVQYAKSGMDVQGYTIELI